MAVTIEDIQTLVGLQLGQRKVSGQDRLLEDLGAESADIVNIIAAVEDKYHISLEEADISRVRTVRDLYDLVKNT
jgi:acyl carrier protein